jgi:hypothetical protein
MSLANPKSKILDKTTNPDDMKKIEDADVFAYNSKFKSKLFKVKVMNVVQKETEQETQETRQKVDEDRKLQ